MLTPLVSKYLCRGLKRVDHFRNHPVETQQEVFRKLIDKNAASLWGLQHDYKHIVSADDFKRSIPISNYESFQPSIEAVRQGQVQALTSDPTRWFAKSSGTTDAKSKFIPINNTSLYETHYACMSDLLAMYLQGNPHSQLFEGKSLVLGGSQQLSSNNTFLEGDLSAILMYNMPFWTNLFRVPDRKTALMSEWDSKLDKIADAAVGKNVTSLSGVPSWMLLLLEKVLDKAGKKSIGEVWPHLELFIHGGVSFAPYRTKYRKLIQLKDMNYFETYNASEGFFAAQDNKDSQDMLLMLDYGIYFEFLPLEELGKEQPQTVDLSEVEVGKNYALVISSVGGLWRYLIGDTIRFTSTRPYYIVVTGRTKSYINAFGEELIVDNAEEALREACQTCDVHIIEYTAAPVYAIDKHSAAHEWLIEFEKAPDDMNAFIKVFDDKLKSVNSDYEAKRYHDLILQPPIIHAVKKGTFYNWLRSKGKLGGQNKIPRLANDRKVLEELLSIVK